MRIALLTHSTNPRGGVVHVTQLAEALTDLGHHVVVHAPDPHGRGFGRRIRCPFVPIPSTAVSADLASLVHQRIREYIEYFEARAADAFDLYHAHDGIGGCALALLVERGHLRGFIRTVHHLDDFAEPYLLDRQDQSIKAAMRVLCVSQMWKDQIQRRYDIRAEQITNGVDLNRFTPITNRADADVRAKLGIKPDAPVFLSVGGVEERKNSVRLLQAFILFSHRRPGAQLLIVGGASLLDHSAYRHSFDTVLQNSGLLLGRDVILTGPIPDEQMPPLMRTATALAFPSVIEGFGLVVLEAMACGTPVVVSQIEPFTEYLTDGDCLFADSLNVDSIAAAMLHACDPNAARTLRERGLAVAARFPWHRTAQLHETIYNQLMKELPDARNAISRPVAR
jgi:glycosyltransferase-like protein